MGSMAPQLMNSMGGMGGGYRPPAAMQTPSPQVQQSQGPQQGGGMGAMLQMLMNQMMGIKGGGAPRRPQPQTASPRDALIQTLMGGSYGR